MADGPASFNRDFTCPGLLRYETQTAGRTSPTGLSPSTAARSNALRLPRTGHPKDLQIPPVPPSYPAWTTAAACHAHAVWALSLSLAATQEITCCFLFLRVLRCFSSPGSPRVSYGFTTHDDRASPRPGSPIRIPMDQRSLAAPHGFSQLATSFFAVLCLGIHPAPLSLDPSQTQLPVRASLRPLGTLTQPLTPFCQKAAPDPASGPRTHIRRRCSGVQVDPRNYSLERR